MSDFMKSSTDLVRELRLRQWARVHFVAMESRQATWHPIVLDEMLRRDREIANEARTIERFDDRIVSAIESSIPPLSDVVTPTTIVQMSEAQRPHPSAGSRIVPLMPDWERGFHPGTSEIPKPHCRAFLQDDSMILNTVEVAEISQYS